MLESTFILLKGVGEFTERRLWDSGIATWTDFRRTELLPGISPSRKSLYDTHLADAQQFLDHRISRYFAKYLKGRDHWRLYETFGPGAVYLDIETTGTAPDSGEVTIVGLYAHGRMTTLIRGETLSESRLQEELNRYDLLVTFFGSVFDIPFLRAKFPGLAVDQPHFDLCMAARRLGYTGGLKRLEVDLGIERPTELLGMDGWEAVRLWHAWKQGSHAALDRLVRYNAADTQNLEPLAQCLHRELIGKCGPPGTIPR